MDGVPDASAHGDCCNPFAALPYRIVLLIIDKIRASILAACDNCGSSFSTLKLRTKIYVLLFASQYSTYMTTLQTFYTKVYAWAEGYKGLVRSI